MEQIARYHVPGSVLGWHMLETDDMTALCEHVNNWGDLLDIEMHPVESPLRKRPATITVERQTDRVPRALDVGAPYKPRPPGPRS